jgi:CheY-like chemotaxis protein
VQRVNAIGLKILIVEDSWQVSTAMKRLLRALGADVIGAVASTDDALSVVAGNIPDVALVDIHLRDGEMATDLIDRLHDHGIHVVVITGYADAAVDRSKVAAVLQKPVNESQLLASLCLVPE